MTICVASGKGGTGKTTVAVNLAVTLTEDKQSVRLLDCDVEEPNCHLFLQPTWQKEEAVNLLVTENCQNLFVFYGNGFCKNWRYNRNHYEDDLSAVT